MNVTNRTTRFTASSRVATCLQAALGFFCLWGMTSQADALEDLQAALKTSNLPIESIADSEVPGLFSLKLADGTTLLTDATGTYFIHGDIYQKTNGRMVNLSEQERSDSRKALIDGLDEAQMVVFAPPPAKQKTTITVFTDIDCGYCRKLHQEVPELNRLGIAVRYLAYPRAGIDSASYDKIVSAWCAPDQKKALTQAKAGDAIPGRSCDNPVKAHFELGELVGVTGTPSIIFEDGRLLPGYLPAARLAAQLGLSSDS
ncbi:DsbC family protein [Pseudomonadales bacterium]|jgi:thiol:disulfide interchange protein DsbC|nr:DsbC family protein [Pseudomonadales bacterium]